MAQAKLGYKLRRTSWSTPGILGQEFVPGADGAPTESLAARIDAHGSHACAPASFVRRENNCFCAVIDCLHRKPRDHAGVSPSAGKSKIRAVNLTQPGLPMKMAVPWP